MTRFKRQSKSATRSANFVSRDPTGARLAMTPSRWTLHSSRFSIPGITGSAEWMPNRVGLRLLRALPCGVFGPGRFFRGEAAGLFPGTERGGSAAGTGWAWGSGLPIDSLIANLLEGGLEPYPGGAELHRAGCGSGVRSSTTARSHDSSGGAAAAAAGLVWAIMAFSWSARGRTRWGG